MIFVLVWCCVSTRFATFIIILQNGPVRSSTLIIFVENLACLVLAVEYILSLNIYNDNCIFTVDSIPFSLKMAIVLNVALPFISPPSRKHYIQKYVCQ